MLFCSFKKILYNTVFVILVFLFIFCYPCVVEKVFLGGQVSKMEIFMDFHILRFLGFENHIYKRLICIYASVISKINTHTHTHTKTNLIFRMCDIYRSFLKHFIKVGRIVQMHTKELQNIIAYGCNFLLVYFQYFSEISYYVCIYFEF